jgi:L-amino acid N-acyltransferase YncA
MNDSVTVRPAERKDLPAILEIYNDAVLKTTATYDYDPRTLEHRTAWFDDHARTGFPIFVAEDEKGRIIGWSSLSRYHDRKGYQFTCENSIYVAESARGRGVGKALLEPLISSAKNMELKAIIAVIDASNEVSVKLHRSFGFETVGLFKNVGYKFHRWLDVLYMELLLPGPRL